MCGIFFYLGEYYTLKQLMEHFMASSHRGPDSSFLRSIESELGYPSFMGFHRLAIMDMSRQGDQPFESTLGGNTHSVLKDKVRNNLAMCNGEIYNHKMLRKQLKPIQSKSDCSVILPFYETYGLSSLVRSLDGDFAFVIVDSQTKCIHLGRDPVGVKPLFYCKTSSGEFIVSSEMKSIIGMIDTSKEQIYMLPSASTLTYDIDKKSIRQSFYWSPRTTIFKSQENDIYTNIREKLILSVKKRLITDRPLGLLISGGLDSSLIAGITKKLLGNDKIQELQSFSIGLKGSPDLENAKIVADYLGTKHHSVYFTVQEGIHVIRDVIRQLETFDITTIRASIPQYLLSKYIREKTDVKVVVSGEGSDELFGGYMYSHKCPDNDEIQKDSQRLIEQLEMFDVLRTDRTTAGNGLEVRVPFLDRGFMKYVLSLEGRWKNPNETSGLGKRIEKKILRDAFYNETEAFIPIDILYRTKNAFSDACGYDWIPSLQKYCESLVTDEEFSTRKEKYPELPPPSIEAFYYRKVFDEFYPNQNRILKHYWLPNWVENNGEPSAKILELL